MSGRCHWGRVVWIGVVVCGALWIGLHLFALTNTPRGAIEREAKLAELRHRIWELEIAVNTVNDFDKDTARQQRTAKAAARQRPFALAQRAVAEAKLSAAQLDA